MQSLGSFVVPFMLRYNYCGFVLFYSIYFKIMFKNIELEFRSIIKEKDADLIFEKIKMRGKMVSKTERLSVMLFGTCNKELFDVKVRITDGRSEVVIKKGDYHSHNRIEYAQDISNDKFIDMVKIFSQLGFCAKVCERITYNFQFSNRVLVSFVSAGFHSYLEIEKMSDKRNEKKDTKELLEIAKDINVKLIKTKKEYDNYCNMLTKTVDWEFHGSKNDFKKLENILKKRM